MATELAQAFVQIMPSARGIKGNLSKVMGPEAASAGHSAGHSIAGGIKSAIAAAGIGIALSKAITEGAALEQSIGGIETLFGAGGRSVEEYAEKVGKSVKDVQSEYNALMASQNTVLANADNAYATAGMSANQYMELTTSFAASLLQSLGGDTAKAADIADMAMTDMSDNANKMGTDMQRITDAYQGFAKQNYTMLDNLKLGYGGTKGEMKRLLADAQKISGVKYDIGNLSDVYEAIHVIQGELDITGTTAKEAASTISGSAKSMKAAFSNVLGKLTLGQDIGPALNALAETTTTFLVGNLLPAVWNILKALPGALLTFFRTAGPQLAQGFMSFLPELRTALTTAAPQMIGFAGQVVDGFLQGFPIVFPKILQLGFALLGKLINGIVTGLPKLANVALQLISMLAAALTENLPMIMTKGAELLVQFAVGIAKSLPQLLTTAAEVILQMAVGLIDNFPQILAAGFDMMIAMIGGIKDAFPSILQAALDIISTIWDTIMETDWLQLGKDIILGLIDGIGAMASALWDAAQSIAKSALDAIKNFFGIASPSKVMRDEVGKWLPLGMAEGITRNTEPVRRAMREMADVNRLPSLAMQMRPAYAGAPAMAGGYGQTVFQQTIYTHDSLSESELTRQAEDMLERQKWRLP